MRPQRLPRRASTGPGTPAGLDRRALVSALGVLLLLAAVGVASAAKPPKPPAGLAATASVNPTVQYLGDTVGTDFTFSVRNTGTIGIGAVEIARPSSSWLVTACPLAPAGWTTQRSDNFCRYRSDTATTDDLAPGSLTSTFQIRATTLAGTADRTGTWIVRVSASNSFDNPSSLKPAPAEAPGLTITAFAWQITDAVVGSGNAGDPCPAASAANHSAITGSTQTILICGRNRMTVSDTPAASRSSLGGTFIADDGTFSSAAIAANSANLVIGKWTGAQIASTAGPGKSIVAKVGSAANRNSPITTLDDICGASPQFQTCIANGGYEALNQPPDAVDDTAGANEDGPAVAIDVLANDSDPDGDPFSITATGGSPAGLVTITGGGSGIDYDPNGQFESLAAGDSTTDTFTYTIADTFGATDTATVTITITGSNDGPDAVDDVGTVGEDSTGTTIFVLANDTDADGDTLTVSAVDTTGTTGLVTNNGTDVTYDPNGAFDSLGAGESDTDTFTYTASDGNGGTDTATVTITITGSNDGPDAVDDVGTVGEDSTGTTIFVLANDTDADGDTLTVSAVDTTGTTGLVTNNGTDVTYDPNGAFDSLGAGESDTDTFTYTASDGNGGTDTATVTITITGSNDGPDAVDDVGTVGEDSTGTTIFVLANDTDADGDTLTVSAVDTTGTTGLVTNNGTDVTYDPNGAFDSLGAGESDTDTFTYTASDGNGGTDTATVTITITGSNDGPDAVDDVGTVGEDSTGTTIFVLANDTDADGDTLTVSAVDTTGTTGLVTNNGTDVTYDPNGAFDSLGAGESDTDTFTYTASDGNGGTDTATVTITITGSNDGPTANDDTDSTSEFDDVVIDALANDTDPDATDVLTISAVDTTGTAGSVTNNGTDVTYDPNGQFDDLEDGESDTDSFTYTVSDGNGGTDTATVTVTINGITDIPPTAVDDSATLAEDPGATAIDVLANDQNADGGPMTISSASDPANGTVVLTGGSSGAHTGLTYEPDPNFCNDPPGTTTDDFTYTLNGGSTATVSVTVTCANDNPIATDDTGSTDEDTTLSVAAPGVLVNDTDADGPSLSVTQLNGSPAAIGVSTAIPSGALVTLNANGSYTFDPNGQFDSLEVIDTDHDSFTYTVADGAGGTATATVTISIHGVNDDPDAVDDVASVSEDSSGTTIDVLANDTDPETPNTVAITAIGTTGTVGSVTNNGTDVTYDPNGQFDGLGVGDTDTDTFTYTVSDGNGGTDTATVTITITGVNDPPTANDDTDTTNEDTSKVVDVLANDTDPDLDTLAVSIVGTPDNGGSVTITNAGANVTFNPGSDFQDLQTGQSRNTSFTYTASDGNGGTDTATVTITVTGVSDAPVADDETFNGANSAVGNTSLVVNDPTDGAPVLSGAKKSITGDILNGDTDVDGPGPLTVTAGTFATADGGSVTIEADGDFTFQPAVGTSCTDVSDFFDYTLEDSGSPELTDIGRVTISISGCVWYVNNNAAGDSGSSSAPFDTLGQAELASDPDSTIYIFRGNGLPVGLTLDLDLDTNQRLHGEAIDLVVDGVTLFTGAGGQRPSLAGSIILGNNNHLSGFSIAGMASVAAISPGTTSIVGGTIANVVVTGSAGGVDLTGTAGTWNLSDLSISTSGGDALEVNNNGPVNFISAGTISVTSAAGAGVRITGTTTSGVIDSVTVSSSPNEGIVLDDNPGALTVNDINLTTTGVGLLVDSSEDVTISGGDADITSANTAVSLTTDGSNPANPPDVTLDQVTSTGGPLGIDIEDIGVGTFSATGGTLSGHVFAEVSIGSGSGNITYGGTIGNGSGRSVDIALRTGGAITLSGNINDTNDAGGGVNMRQHRRSVTFSGATKTLNTGALPAVAWPRTGRTINLTAAASTSTRSSGAGLSATGGGTVQVTTGANPNTIDTGAGTAVNISEHDHRAPHVTFRSVNPSAAQRIVLTTTGTTSSRTARVLPATSPSPAERRAHADWTGGTIQARPATRSAYRGR